jgi:hypothetical protein
LGGITFLMVNGATMVFIVSKKTTQTFVEEVEERP